MALSHRLRRNPLDESGSARASSARSAKFSAHERRRGRRDALAAREPRRGACSRSIPRLRPAAARGRRPGARRAARAARRTLAPVKLTRMPAQIADDRLIGGLDVAATLRTGKPVAETGVLADGDGGVRSRGDGGAA